MRSSPVMVWVYARCSGLGVLLLRVQSVNGLETLAQHAHLIRGIVSVAGAPLVHISFLIRSAKGVGVLSVTFC